MAEQGALLAKDTADTFMIAVYSYKLTMVKFNEVGTILASSELDRDVNTFLLGKSVDVSDDSSKIFIAYATEENSGTIFFGSHNANDLTLIKTQKISVGKKSNVACHYTGDTGYCGLLIGTGSSSYTSYIIKYDAMAVNTFVQQRAISTTFDEFHEVLCTYTTDLYCAITHVKYTEQILIRLDSNLDEQ